MKKKESHEKLRVVRFLKGNGLGKLRKKFHIRTVVHQKFANLVQCNYHSQRSDFSNPMVRECRNLILDTHEGGFGVVCLGFTKFFNYGHGSNIASQEDFEMDTTVLQEKIDGSILILYHYKNEWFVSSNNTPDASGVVPSCGMSLADIFWEIWNEEKYQFPVDKSKCYMFEMTTPRLLQIVQHKTDSLTLIGVRDMLSLQEVFPFDHIAQKYKWKWTKNIKAQFNSLTQLLDHAKTKLSPVKCEGYVLAIVRKDKKVERYKIKCPEYVFISQLKNLDSRSSKQGHFRSQKKQTEVLWNLIAQERYNFSDDEFLLYFPKWKIPFENISKKVHSWISNDIVPNLKFYSGLHDAFRKFQELRSSSPSTSENSKMMKKCVEHNGQTLRFLYENFNCYHYRLSNKMEYFLAERQKVLKGVAERLEENRIFYVWLRSQFCEFFKKQVSKKGSEPPKKNGGHFRKNRRKRKKKGKKQRRKGFQQHEEEGDGTQENMNERVFDLVLYGSGHYGTSLNDDSTDLDFCIVWKGGNSELTKHRQEFTGGKKKNKRKKKKKKGKKRRNKEDEEEYQEEEEKDKEKEKEKIPFCTSDVVSFLQSIGMKQIRVREYRHVIKFECTKPSSFFLEHTVSSSSSSKHEISEKLFSKERTFIVDLCLNGNKNYEKSKLVKWFLDYPIEQNDSFKDPEDEKEEKEEQDKLSICRKCVLLIKYILKCHFCVTKYNRKLYLNSFSLTLMVIYIFQKHDILPPFNREKVERKKTKKSKSKLKSKKEEEERKKRKVSVGEMVFRFFKYFRDQFVFEEMYVSVFQGKVLSLISDTHKFDTKKLEHWGFVVEDPIEQCENTARTVKKKGEREGIEMLKEILRETTKKIEELATSSQEKMFVDVFQKNELEELQKEEKK